jgi:release factor glutamine methyltransferase
MYDYTQCLARSEASRARTPRPREIRLLGADWLLLPEVFSPADSKSSLAHLELIDFPAGGSFLEIGSGTGLIAVRAALAGCARVCATDVNPAAVRNTELNAARFGVASQVTSLQSDMFSAVPADATFDVIYWHSNNVWAPSAMAVDSPLTLAYVDPGYDAHLRFFRGAPEHLAPGGRILLAVSSRAGRAELAELAAGAGQRLEPVKAATVTEPEGPVVYELMEVVPG